MPDGDMTKLYVIPSRPPQVGQSTAEGNAQLLATALKARDDKLPTMAGNMNSVSWEDVIWRTQRIEPFRRQGGGSPSYCCQRLSFR